jgi:hypothetical protein
MTRPTLTATRRVLPRRERSGPERCRRAEVSAKSKSLSLGRL